MQNYRINTPHIVSEVFADEEAAIINLKTGNYYSLNKTATEIWTLIEKGLSFDEITLFIQNNFKFNNSFQSDEIKQFVENLINEGLIAINDAPSLVQTNPANPSTTNQKEYEPPVIECYPDMQELLLLDPIHEVEETNWLVNKTN